MENTQNLWPTKYEPPLYKVVQLVQSKCVPFYVYELYELYALPIGVLATHTS